MLERRAHKVILGWGDCFEICKGPSTLQIRKTIFLSDFYLKRAALKWAAHIIRKKSRGNFLNAGDPEHSWFEGSLETVVFHINTCCDTDNNASIFIKWM